MSRRKVDYDFCPTPRRWHPVWAGASLHARAIVRGLFELNDGGPITVEGDWLESLCKQMVINGRDRPNVRKLLRDYQAKGAVIVTPGEVKVAFHPHDQLTPTCEASVGKRRGPVADLSGIGEQSNIPTESNPQNDSTHDRQTDRQTDNTNRERDARAHARASGLLCLDGGARTEAPVFERRPLPPEPPDLPPPKPELWCTVLRLYQAAYEQRRPGLAAPRREQAAKQLALWCEHSAQAYRCTPEEMAGRVISGLFASERAAEARWPLGYAAHDPEEYAGDLPGAPAVLRPQAKRYAGMSRVPTPEEYAAAANEEDPW